MFDSSKIIRADVVWFMSGCSIPWVIEIMILGKDKTSAVVLLPQAWSIPLLFLAVRLFSNKREIALRAAYLGMLGGQAALLAFHGDQLHRPLGLYVVCLAWFHFSEYLFTAMCNPREVSTSSFMLYHSPGYIVALIGSVAEFLIEVYLLPDKKGWVYPFNVIVGLLICVVGETLRKRAMWVAGPNFNHKVQHNLQDKDHVLITHDVYKYIQHPSYSGWFCFTIGTQIILANPFCLVTFAFVMVTFFKNRIIWEAGPLRMKHGEKYDKYASTTPKFFPKFWFGDAHTVFSKDL